MCKDSIQCACHRRMKEVGMERQREQTELVDLTRNEKEALLWALRAFRDNCPDEYDKCVLCSHITADFCNAWDKLKK